MEAGWLVRARWVQRVAHCALRAGGAEDRERGKDSVETGGVEHLEVEDWWRTKG